MKPSSRSTLHENSRKVSFQVLGPSPSNIYLIIIFSIHIMSSMGQTKCCRLRYRHPLLCWREVEINIWSSSLCTQSTTNKYPFHSLRQPDFTMKGTSCNLCLCCTIPDAIYCLPPSFLFFSLFMAKHHQTYISKDLFSDEWVTFSSFPLSFTPVVLQ